MIDISTHSELYFFDSTEKVANSLNFAKMLPSSGFNETVTFHFYWRVPKDFTRKQVLPIKSAVVSHDLNKTKFVLWSNVDLNSNLFVRPLLPFIETRIWNAQKESKDTPLDNCNVLKGIVDDPLCYLGGDMFRLLCLYKYGGIYIDMDVVVLRNFEPLLPYEFMYQWGSSGTSSNEPIMKQNGAIMRLKDHSQICCDLLNELGKTPGNPNSTCWGTDLYHKVRQKNSNWSVFPCAWFNTEWGLGIPLQPFKKNQNGNNSLELYDGAFAWHWHNKWDDNIEEGSKFQILENITDMKFQEIRNG